MYASYGLNSRTQLSWPPIIHRLTFLITIQGRRNVKNLDGNKPIRWAGSAPPPPLIGIGLTYWQKFGRDQSPHTSSYVPAALTIPKKCITIKI